MATKDVTQAELAVLEALWAADRCSVRELAEQLYPGGGNSENATVQKLCERLRDKGLVDEDRSVRPRKFRALVEREALIDRRLNAVAEDLCAGRKYPLITQLLSGGRFTAEQLEALRRKLERLEHEAEEDR